MRRSFTTLTLLASGAKTASGTGTAHAIATYDYGEFYLDVTAQAGTTPTLDVDIQTYDHVGGDWHNVVSFTQVAATTGSSRTTSQYLGERIRTNFTIGGTNATYTFSVGAIVKS